MKKYGVNELRRMFLEFFESKGHLAMKSFSLVPHNDKSLLLINSGMAPLKPYFTGAEIPPRRRVTTCQKCIRTGDIENVGKTARHGTFFEMLGNFSFGDYFKTEAISWTWEFLTEVVGLDADRLYPSIYEEDEEAFEIWNKKIGIAPERIFRFGKGDNFWEHGSGPCGPCSEVYYDRGEKYGCGSPDCTVGCECDRYMEVWNNVFTQFNNDGNGNYTELEQKNIDTGMGLERLAVVVQDVDSIFDVDTIEALRNKVCEYAHVTYKENEEKDVSIRLITDHIRSATFMISDGIMPTNEGRGYVLRRLIRRAARHGRLLGIQGGFLSGLSETVIAGSKDGYPELEEKKEFILKVLAQEEEKFNKTIDQGLSILAGMEADMEKAGKKELDGKDAFILYDTYGFPLDLTKEILEEKGYSIDESGFKAAMEEQRKKARSARATTNYMGKDATVYDEIDVSVTTEFVGYDRLSHESKITVLTTEKEITEALSDGDKGTVLVEQTPFYATMGGQEGDTGVIRTTEGEFRVESTIKLMGGKVGHVGYMTKGMLKAGDTAVLEVNAAGRNATCKNHSATHLLQKALKTVLGSHVEQKGSLVTPNRLRFDFAHFAPMTQEEIAKAEELVNREIQASLPVVTEIMNVEDAKKSGAMALFGEKYEDEVRVVSMGDFSRELCGGTHTSATGTIGLFKIVSESAISAGVRRIEAVTGEGAERILYTVQDTMQSIEQMLHSPRLVQTIEKILEGNDALSRELDEMRREKIVELADKIVAEASCTHDVLLIARRSEYKTDFLKDLAYALRQRSDRLVLVMGNVVDGKATLSVMLSDAIVERGVDAGAVVREAAKLIGGGGGGQKFYATAGGKNPDGVQAAIDRAVEMIMEKLN